MLPNKRLNSIETSGTKQDILWIEWKKFPGKKKPVAEITKARVVNYKEYVFRCLSGVYERERIVCFILPQRTKFFVGGRILKYALLNFKIFNYFTKFNIFKLCIFVVWKKNSFKILHCLNFLFFSGSNNIVQTYYSSH